MSSQATGSEPTPGPATIRGDEALARGALAAGVSVVSGYPGSPATGVFDSILSATQPADAHVQWAPNEKVAMELAFGASLAGSRALVVLKSVGMNIALDPLATISLSGSHGGLVILLGDDPGGWASQNEQDSRWAARVAEVPLVEPTSVAQAQSLMTQAFVWSESLGLPVIVRVTRALALAKENPVEPWVAPPAAKRFLRRRNRWIVLPYLVVEGHRRLHRLLREFQQGLASSPYDSARGDGEVGIVGVGYAHRKLLDVLGPLGDKYRVLALSSSWPLPDEALLPWLEGVERVLVLEEGGPFVEQQVRALVQRSGLGVEILGRETRSVPAEGELAADTIAQALAELSPSDAPEANEPESRAMPSTVALCDDCPYRPVFEALIGAMERNGGREKHTVVGETGCMVRANLPPMELFDVKYSLGSGLGIGLGLALSQKAQRVVALVGDSSFFHSDINAMPYATQLDPPMVMIVLDNGTTALTGGQAHPGSPLDERGDRRTARADLAQVIRGCGATVQSFSPDQVDALGSAIDEALTANGLSVLLVRGPCPRYLGAG